VSKEGEKEGKEGKKKRIDPRDECVWNEERRKEFIRRLGKIKGKKEDIQDKIKKVSERIKQKNTIKGNTGGWEVGGM